MNIIKQTLEAMADLIAKRLLDEPLIKSLVKARAQDGGVVHNPSDTLAHLLPPGERIVPRYHAGGIVGLKPGEVPAILSPGGSFVTREVYDRMMEKLPQGDPLRTAEVQTYVVNEAGEITKVDPR